MSFTRRQLLAFTGAAALLSPLATSACLPLRRRPEPRLLESRAPLPRPFSTPLPIPPVLQPVRRDPGADVYEMTLRASQQEILPGLKTTVWGYDGLFPGPTLDTRRGRRIVVRQRNALPVPIVTHLHGGQTPSASDGYPTDLVLPDAALVSALAAEGATAHARAGWPTHAAAHGATSAPMHDPHARIAHGTRDYVFPLDQPAATLWYHDHRMDFTAPQVWRGLAGFLLVRDDEEERLPLPKGEREIPLMLCDRAVEADGAFRYPALDPSLRGRPGVAEPYAGGVLGDVMLVNGAPWPTLDVATARYRFRLLNASNARRYELTLDPPPPDGVAFVQIGSDGGLLDRPIAHRTLAIAPAERFDVLVDFAKYPVGTAVTLRNTAGTGSAGQIMRFTVARAERDDSRVPERLRPLEKLDPAKAAVTRAFTFATSPFDDHAATAGNAHPRWLINGQPFDPARMDARPRRGDVEIWRISSDIRHPVHLHLAPFQVLGHAGRPSRFDAGWKDTIDLGPGHTATIIMRFTGEPGRYVFHCHNLEHEDMAMMGNFELV